MTDYPTIKISEIVIEDRLRDVDANWKEALSVMISEAGLLQPIVLWKDGKKFRLVAGAHRIEAYKLLEKTEIEYRLSQASSYEEARRDEIIENIGRNELNVLDRARNYFELKLVYETLHPETKKGVAGAEARHGRANDILSFADDTAEKTKLSKRNIERLVAIWKGLSGDSKKRAKGTWLANHQGQLTLLSQQKAPVQKKIMDMIFGDKPKATTVGDAITILEQGKLPTHVEQKYASLNKAIGKLEIEELDAVLAAHPQKVTDWLPVKLSKLQDDEFDALMSANPAKVDAWLKRTGRA